MTDKITCKYRLNNSSCWNPRYDDHAGHCSDNKDNPITCWVKNKKWGVKRGSRRIY